MTSLPSWLLTSTPVFHITAIHNLASILSSGFIYSTNHIAGTHHSIANEDVQRTRASKAVALPPYGVIHDYVPFYFAPRSPMLFVNHKGGIPNAVPQEDILHFVTTAQHIENSGLLFVFYDRHAIVAIAKPYNNLEYLDKIDWELFFERPLRGDYAEYWQDRHDERNPKWLGRKEVRQAEFLVHESLPWHLIQNIATINQQKANEVRGILASLNIETPVIVKPEWYY